MWLYRATKNQQYLNDAKSFHEGETGWALSWDDKKVACQVSVLVTRVPVYGQGSYSGLSSQPGQCACHPCASVYPGVVFRAVR